ncbi:methyltransferase domain-containing protein [Leucobacter denitrificans]|uniref:Methyltransferase domain-containing protein n=1 Tax=Leucobacter denitrificans TaxID=683042 RepID=A0A7G9S7G8_9MICO|nr:methyltransferase domain-containing protein [Leucobacter denitrificans]
MDLSPPHCDYFAAGVCRSCTFIETPISAQLEEKQARCTEFLPGIPSEAWLPPVGGGVRAFRNRAKLAVGGEAGDVTLGILDREWSGVDLSECLIHENVIRSVTPTLKALVNDSGIEPYLVPKRRGELKYVHVTANLSSELMVRFVVRTEHGLGLIKRQLSRIRQALPNAVVISVNLLPEHKAVLEGEREVTLHGEALAMQLAGETQKITLHLRPQSFFQTNTQVATALYNQASQWVDRIDPASVLDLYCGVGGFALFTASGATGSRRVLGVEVSEQAIRSAKRSAKEAGIPAQFFAADATDFAVSLAREEMPELVIVNPPRRGIGEELAGWIERSPIHHVIYSSCNPASLARDLERMPSLHVKEARLFDMFPHTGHLEVAVLLERVSAAQVS